VTPQTLQQAFVENAKKRGNKPYLFYKHEGKWQSISWREVNETVMYMSLAFMSSLGVKKGDRLAPISETRPEMAYFCLATAASGAIFSAIYHTNSPKECTHVINDSGARIAYAENQLQLDKLKIAWPDCPHLDRIVVHKLEKPEDDPRVITLEQLIALGKEEFRKNGDRAYYERIETVRPDDLIAIVYTSGTTGAPKGVMLTIGGMIRHHTELSKFFPMSKKSRGISVLPMAHQLELLDGHWRHVLYGFPQVYAESIRTLYDDIRETKPTFIYTTPRFFEKIYNEMMAYIDASPPWKRKLIDWSLRLGARYQDIKYDPHKGISYLWRRLLYVVGHAIFFNKVHGTVGGKMEWSSTGSAPIPAKILLFFRACNFPIYEGFGQTESAGLISMNRPGRVKVGTVGLAMPGSEIKIAEDGEILVKGWNRCAGYWHNPKATEELFEDGWLCTGDLGSLDKDGFLRISGRKKEILITSTGKNISPSNIQVLLKTIPYIAEAVVFGEGKTYLTAIITLDEENITQYAKEHNISYADFVDLSRHPAVRELIEKEIEVKNQELANIERIKKVTILEDQFRQDRDEIGPTMKVKRNIIEQRYKDKIDTMYAE
jgi:long-chain acyl-CoA synthetase